MGLGYFILIEHGLFYFNGVVGIEISSCGPMGFLREEVLKTIFKGHTSPRQRRRQPKRKEVLLLCFFVFFSYFSCGYFLLLLFLYIVGEGVFFPYCVPTIGLSICFFLYCIFLSLEV